MICVILARVTQPRLSSFGWRPFLETPQSLHIFRNRDLTHPPFYTRRDPTYNDSGLREQRCFRWAGIAKVEVITGLPIAVRVKS